ncbi:MAG: 4Fe-4S binding protein [Treponema sp.]|nr:4Fe-4S binding protein [Treponema sp.]
MSYNITDLCSGCTACAKLCPVFAISGERNGRHAINSKRCVDCGVCGRICPKNAVTDNLGKTCVSVKRSQWPKPVIAAGECSACSICVHDCTASALRITQPKFRGDINVCAELHQPQKCTGCGICESRCPLKAIKMSAPNTNQSSSENSGGARHKEAAS